MQNEEKQAKGQEDKAKQVETKAQSAITRVADALTAFIKAQDAQSKSDQSKEQRKLRRETLTRVIAGVSAGIALVALVINGIQAGTAKQALYAVQRAFVALSSPQATFVHLKASGATRDVYMFSVGLTNGGNTVARRMTTQTHIQLVNPSDVASFDYQAPDSKEDIPYALAPRQSILTSSQFADAEVVRSLGTAGKPDLLFWGDIKYIDIFDAHHLTEFCYDYNSTAIADPSPNADAPAPIPQPNAVTCPTHNCVDEDCANVSPK